MSSWTTERARLAVTLRHHPDADVTELRHALEEARQEDDVCRSIDDPAALARAARIVRGALARRRLTLAELTSDLPGAA